MNDAATIIVVILIIAFWIGVAALICTGIGAIIGVPAGLVFLVLWAAS